VGSLRGTANNLGGAVGTGIAGALLIGVLSASIKMNLADNPLMPRELKAQVDLDKVDFVGNDRRLIALERTTAAPDQKPRQFASTRNPGFRPSRSQSLCWRVWLWWRSFPSVAFLTMLTLGHDRMSVDRTLNRFWCRRTR
jgi:hypothetical protein